MTQIELIGCTSAGKSTLARGICQAGREHGIDTIMGEEVVLKQIRLNWVNQKMVRTLCVDLLCLFACLATWRDNLDFYLFAIRIISRSPVGWFEKLNIARNVLKNIGIYETVRRRSSDHQVVLLDEGTLHTAHYLFVHVYVGGPKVCDLAKFVQLVPLPDVVIYVRQDEAILIQRTLARGHKRIPNGSHTQAELFIKRGAKTFDYLAKTPTIDRRLLVVDSMRRIIVAKDHQMDPSLASALDIIRAGMDAISADHPIENLPAQDAEISKQHTFYQNREKI